MDKTIVTRNNIYLFLALCAIDALELTVVFVFIKFHFNQMESRFHWVAFISFYPYEAFVENGSVDQYTVRLH